MRTRREALRAQNRFRAQNRCTSGTNVTMEPRFHEGTSNLRSESLVSSNRAGQRMKGWHVESSGWGSRGRHLRELCAHNAAHAARSAKSTKQGSEHRTVRERHERYDGTPFARRHFEPSKLFVESSEWGSHGRAPIELCAQQAHSAAHAARSTKSTHQGPEHRTVRVRQGLLLTDLLYN